MTWDFQGRNGTSKAGMGLPRPELAGREETCTTAGGNWMGKEFTTGCDIQGRNCQVGRWEEEFTTGDGTSKMGTGLPHDMGLPRPELADREMGRGI